MHFELIQKYKDFLKHLDATVLEITQSNKSNVQCKLGCNSCCKSGLTVSQIELQLIKKHFDALTPSKQKELIDNLGKMGPSYCEFLETTGGCAIYESRPVVCRTQGVPNRLINSDSGSIELSICSLNYLNVNPASIVPEETIDSDTISLIKAAFNREIDPDDPGRRFDLKSSVFMGEN